MASISSDYLYDALSPDHIQKIINSVVKFLRPRKDKYDAIAFRGMSGALVAPTVAYKLKKTLLMIRKPSSSHTSRVVEGDRSALRYVIIDDFISTGETVEIIQREVKDFNNATCTGIILYLSANSKRGLTHFADKYNCWVKQFNNNGYENGTLVKQTLLPK